MNLFQRKTIDMYSYNYLKSFVKDLFLKIGCSEKDAEIIADVLLAAELRGIGTHGLMRVPEYINLWEKGRINVKPDIRVVHETPSTAVVEGDSGLGMVVAHFAMKIAMEKAKNVGTGWVSVRNSNHFGIAGYFSMMALKEDMIGISMTNANPLVAPTFSKDALLGTNPISVSIPAGTEPPFVADFATTPVSRGKLDLMKLKGEKAPYGFVQDKNGHPTDDPGILSDGGAILPLGGDREHGSHKGYCLGAIVDIFSAVLSGANFGPFVVPSLDYVSQKKGNSPGKGLGHFFGAMRIDGFQPAGDFKKYMDKWIRSFKYAKPVEGQDQVYIPGEPEREMEKLKMKNGIELIDSVRKKIEVIAEKFDMKLG